MKKVTDLKENECISFKNKKEFRKVLRLNPKNNTKKLVWKDFKKETIYYPCDNSNTGGYSSVSHAEKYNYTIHPASEFIQPTYKLTKEQVLAIAENPSLVKELFPDVFEVELEVGRWYKSPHLGKALFRLTKIEGNTIYGYGFDYKGIWNKESEFTSLKNKADLSLATPEEVETALVNEAKRRYKLNDKVIGLGLYFEVGFDKSGTTKLTNNTLRYLGTDVFKNGTWASIITTPNDVIKLIEFHGKDKLITLIEAYDNRNSK